MIKIEPLNFQKISKGLDLQFKKIFGKNPSIDIETLLNDRQKQNRKVLKKYLEDYLILYDEGIKMVIQLHELFKENHLKNDEGLAFVALTAKMISSLIGIRKMIYSGLPDCEKNLNRSLHETIDIFYACLINDELNQSYARADKMYDNDDFYWKNFSKNKLEKECTKLFRKISVAESQITFFNDRRKYLKSFFSESIHASFNSAFAAYSMFTLDLEISTDYIGKVTTGYPKMLMSLIEDLYIFNVVAYISLDQKLCKSIEKIDIHSNFMYLHYHKKYDVLYLNNHEKLYAQSELHSNFIKEVRDTYES